MAKKQIKYVNVEADGRQVSLRADQYLLWGLREAGYDIPHFCAHKWLEPFGGCRMCMIKVEMGGRMMPKLQTSCSMKPAEGMRVFTTDAEVIQARKEQLEFHLLNHPLECPVCDKGGECMLQNQTMDHGWAAGRYIEQKRSCPDTIFNDYVRMNYKRCIHCKRCIHFCSDIDGSYLLQFIDRGAETYIESFPNAEEAPRFSGNVIDMCPVGALTARSYRFMGRPWEQAQTASIGSLDSLGANIWICNRLGKIARIVPRDNEDVEGGYIDDATRFHWECFEDERRVRQAILRDGGEQKVSQAAGEEHAGRVLAGFIGEYGPESVGIIAGGGLNNEEYMALRLFAAVLDTPYYFFGSELAGRDSASLQALQSMTSDFAPLSDVLAASTVLSIGCDLFEEAPALGLRLDIAARRGQLTLLSARSHRSAADRFASEFVDYSYGNLLRMVRGLTNALTGSGEAPAELAPLAAKLKSCGEDCAILYGDEVWRSENPLELIAALAALRSAVAATNPAALGVYLCPVLPEVNSAGALLLTHLQHFSYGKQLQAEPSVGSLRKVLEAAASGKLKALLVVDSDIVTTYPDRALVEKALKTAAVIYCGPFANPTSEMAATHLPLGTYAHRDGTVLSMEWRLQKRSRSALDTVAPSVLDVVDSLCGAMDHEPVAETIPDLALRLKELVADWPADGYDALPAEGVLFKPRLAQAAEAARAEMALPAEFKPTAEEPLVLVPKRFLYNERQELRFSRVFDKVWRPYCAFVNPLDLKVHNLSEGEACTFSAGGREFKLPVKAAPWVRAGSVVINDYYFGAPANAVIGFKPLRAAVQKNVRAGGSK